MWIAALPAQADEPWPDGGDVVTCISSSDPTLPPPGYYSLDYFVSIGLDFDGLAPAHSLNDSLNRIAAILATKVGRFTESFATFRQYYRKSLMSLPQFWMQGTVDVRRLSNPDVVDIVPPNCRNGDHAMIIKVVDRKVLGNGRILFTYLPSFVDRIERENPLQLSYLLVHEWLWSISNHPARNRRINHFLHSRRADLLTANEVVEELRGMGLDL